MTDSTKTVQSPIVENLNLLWRHRKSLLIWNGAFAVVVVIILLLIPKEYESSVLFVVESEQNLGQLSALLSELPISFAGQNASPVDRFLALATTRRIVDQLIDEFNLDEYYGSEYRQKNRDAFTESLGLIDNQNGTVTIRFISEDPELSAKVVNRAYELIRDLEVELSITKARRFREFIEERYVEAMGKLNEYEDSLRVFSELTGLISIEDQLQQSIELLGGVESKKLELEIQREFLQSVSSRENSAYKKLSEEIRALENKISEIKKEDSYSSIAIDDLPEITLDYIRLFRDVKIQEKVVEFLIPQVESAKVEEKKTYTNITLIDEGIAAELKSRPKRLQLLIIFSFLFFVASFFWLKLRDFYFANRQQLLNGPQAK